VVLVFTAAYIWLLVHQSLIFARYMLPVIPAICLMLALGLTAVLEVAGWIGADGTRRRRAALLVPWIVLVPPTIQSVSFDLNRRYVTTDEQAARWLKQNVDPAALIEIEGRTIQLPPNFHVEYTNRLIHESVETYREHGVVYLVANVGPDQLTNPLTPPADIAAYRRFLAGTEILKAFPQTRDHPGATLTVFKVR
jgi:hypothetical protein